MIFPAQGIACKASETGKGDSRDGEVNGGPEARPSQERRAGKEQQEAPRTSASWKEGDCQTQGGAADLQDKGTDLEGGGHRDFPAPRG